MSDAELVALNNVRNEEVKDWTRVTTEHVVNALGGHLSTVVARTTDEWEREETYPVAYVESLAPGSRIRHEFLLPPWEGLAVLPVLKSILDRLEFEIVPVALEFTRQWGPSGRDMPFIGNSEIEEFPAFIPEAWCIAEPPDVPGTIKWVYTAQQPDDGA
ncbi:hypothetical protein [Leifsonia shinshuensis]|uniref:hypothetical protein n=1 Tax=Leifsonia shinshuensis TaxID=150026 RepID=UPI00285A45F7|nr:hypothetical protein [Leifsonia shinshuensis]MDR6971352.1 hypothetical protein [Leifsonia shinshuensis]